MTMGLLSSPRTSALCTIFALTLSAGKPSIAGNTPAMPLTEAHFGGFFVPGGRV